MKEIFGAKDSVFFELCVHRTFASKYCRRLFNARAIEALRGIFADVCLDAQATLVEMDGEDDPVHSTASLLAILPELKDGVCRAFWSGVGWLHRGDLHFHDLIEQVWSKTTAAFEECAGYLESPGDQQRAHLSPNVLHDHHAGLHRFQRQLACFRFT
jgi:REP element-mobilizing transposase RayT